MILRGRRPSGRFIPSARLLRTRDPARHRPGEIRPRADKICHLGRLVGESRQSGRALWAFHPFKFAEAGARDMPFTTSTATDWATWSPVWHAHGYGLVWWKQVRDGKGGITWKLNEILPARTGLAPARPADRQMHALDLVDLDGDGLKDIVTGKRFWAHGPKGDVQPDGPAVVYRFPLRRRQRRSRVHPSPHR